MARPLFVWPDRFFPFLFVVAEPQIKTEKSGLATLDYFPNTKLDFSQQTAESGNRQNMINMLHQWS